MVNELSKEDLLIAIDRKSTALINLGPQLMMITPNLQIFDMFLIAILNRTINLNKAFTSLMRNNNFIAAAPLVRINLDSLMRMYAATISEYDMNSFASKVMAGDFIRKMKVKDSSEKMTDAYLVEKLSKISGMEWVTQVYSAGNSFVHFGDKVIFSSQKIADEKEKLVNFSIGFHDSFIAEGEKIGAIIWMNKIIDSIVEQAQLWMNDKANSIGFDITKLNDIDSSKNIIHNNATIHIKKE